MPSPDTLMAKTDLTYLSTVPRQVPEGRIVVHNHVRPAKQLGDRGFRAWTEAADTPLRVPCPCGWAPHLAKHYRVDRGADDA